MYQRIITGWSFRRVLYLFMGLAVVAQSILQKEWILIPFGIYFAAMGLFGFGCASGNCARPFEMKEEALNDESILNKKIKN